MQENQLDNFIKLLSKLPSFGPRSARRIALHLIKNKEKIMIPLIESMSLVNQEIKNCQNCGNLDISEICKICQDQKRQDNIICVIEDVSDLWAIEKANIFNGKYHVLGGTLSAMSGVSPNDLNINSLIAKLQENKNIKEIIIATNPTMDGQTTAYYLLELLKEFNLKISKLAHGIPIGGELDYLDEGTLDIALKTRSEFN